MAGGRRQSQAIAGTLRTRLKDEVPKELFNFVHCYDCIQCSITKPVQLIAAKFFIEGFPLKLMMSTVSCLNTQHYFQGTK